MSLDQWSKASTLRVILSSFFLYTNTECSDHPLFPKNAAFVSRDDCGRILILKSTISNTLS